MTWLLAPSTRADLLLEFDDALDSSDGYTSAWIESAGISDIRVACNFNGGESYSVNIEEGIYTTHDSGPVVIRTQTVPYSSLAAFAELPITTRYFRLVIDGSGSGDQARVSVRSI